MATKMPEFNWQHEPLPEAFKAFKAGMVLFIEDQAVTDPAKQATKIHIAIGDEGIRRVFASSLTTAEQKIPGKLWTMLDCEKRHHAVFSQQVSRMNALSKL